MPFSYILYALISGHPVHYDHLMALYGTVSPAVHTFYCEATTYFPAFSYQPFVYTTLNCPHYASSGRMWRVSRHFLDIFSLDMS